VARDLPTNDSDSSKPWFLQFVPIAVASTVLLCGGMVYTIWRLNSSSSATTDAPLTTTQLQTVTALGRIEPQGDVIKLSVSNSVEGNRIDQLLVQEGDRVQFGQVIAILDNRDRLQAAVLEAQEKVRVAQAQLAQALAGDSKLNQRASQQANIARIKAQLQTETMARDAEIARIEAQLRNAERTLARYQSLYQEGAERAISLDEKRERYETTLAQLQQAKAQRATIVATLTEQIRQEQSALQMLTEVRPVDVQVAQAQVDLALASLKRAQANLNQVYVRAPRVGQILKIHAYPGEIVTSDGIADLGQTDRMYAIAEVYESDISRVRPGQSVKVLSDSLPKSLNGTVEYVALQVKKQNVVNTDPSANIDGRIVEVKIRLDPLSSQKVAPYTNLQIRAVINTVSLQSSR